MHEMSLNEVAVAETAEVTPGRFLPSLLMMFVGSGCSALIYEIVWFQLLELVIGSSAVSLGVLLGTFMGGMCLGSLLFPQLIGPGQHPLRVYAALELGIGAIGIALLFALPHVDDVYVASAMQGWVGVLLRGVVTAAILLAPFSVVCWRASTSCGCSIWRRRLMLLRRSTWRWRSLPLRWPRYRPISRPQKQRVATGR